MIKVKATYAQIWQISYPVIIGSLAQTALVLTDTAFLGRVGETELGASVLGGIYFFLLTMLGAAIGIGAQILIARKAGEGDAFAVGKIFDNAFVILGLFSAVLLVLLYLASPFIFQFLSSEIIRHSTNEFIKYRGWGIVFVMISFAFRSFYIGIGQTRIITYSAILMTGLNILLGYALIFGNFNMPRMGLEGAGLANAISEAAAAIFLLAVTCRKAILKEYSLFQFSNIRLSVFRSIMNLSAPVLTQHLISMGAWFLFFLLIERLGSHALAISSIVRSAYMLMMTPVWGYAACTNSMTSNLIGQGKSEEVIPLLKKILLLSSITSGAVVILGILFPEWILKLTTSDVHLIEDSLKSLYVIFGAMMFLSTGFVLFSGVSGTGNTKVAMYIEIFNIIVYVAYVYICVFILHASIEWVWTTEIIYWALMGILSYLYLKSGRWKGKKLTL